MILVIFYPKMKKEEKHNIYSTATKVIFFFGLWACRPARPAPLLANVSYAGQANAGKRVGKVSSPCIFYQRVEGRPRFVIPTSESIIPQRITRSRAHMMGALHQLVSLFLISID